jgi:hypothetical protein
LAAFLGWLKMAKMIMKIWGPKSNTGKMWGEKENIAWIELHFMQC